MYEERELCRKVIEAYDLREMALFAILVGVGTEWSGMEGGSSALSVLPLLFGR